jgi:ribosomal protein L29
VVELNEAFKAVKMQMASELELNAKTQKELETDLTGTKHQLLEIQHQLSMTEKVPKTGTPETNQEKVDLHFKAAKWIQVTRPV